MQPTKSQTGLSRGQKTLMAVGQTISPQLTLLAILLPVLYVLPSPSPRTLLTSQGDYEDTQSDDGSRRRREGGGIDLPEQFQQGMFISGKVSDTLIDSEFSGSASGARPGTWSEVAGTKSWHTDTAATSSARSSVDPTPYGRPGARSVAGSARSFNSNITERSQTGSDQIEMRNGFAKVKAYVSASLQLNLGPVQ